MKDVRRIEGTNIWVTQENEWIIPTKMHSSQCDILVKKLIDNGFISKGDVHFSWQGMQEVGTIVKMKIVNQEEELAPYFTSAAAVYGIAAFLHMASLASSSCTIL